MTLALASYSTTDRRRFTFTVSGSLQAGLIYVTLVRRRREDEEKFELRAREVAAKRSGDPRPVLHEVERWLLPQGRSVPRPGGA
jgi:hypothetical protein